MSMRKLRIVRNRHGSAWIASVRWCRGTLWGCPLLVGANNVHVYGAWRRHMVRVNVQFTDTKIVVDRVQKYEKGAEK